MKCREDEVVHSSCPWPAPLPPRFLLTGGVFPAPVNNEGDTPVDLAEDENIVDMIKQQIDKLGVWVCVGVCVWVWVGGEEVGGMGGGGGDEREIHVL